MEVTLNTKYDIGDHIVINKDTLGIVVGIKITIRPIPENINMILSDKVYLIDIRGEIIEIEEQLLKKIQKGNNYE